MKEQQIVNLLIAYELLDYLIDNPDLRFIQALWALGIADGSDLFYEPSKKTLEKVRARLKLETESRKENECQNIKDFQERLRNVLKEIDRLGKST